ncbi:DUF1592 domain-containing protein [Aureliella helgolandensis]|uniref:Planctomycete cytochrome C n=1 Tax=Aureliella helgolandensis TaxID=2527968 RepID=A0A518G937_9BACT|nr:DUF1592 domain-containing protein [Aureliella helgolandensis]QDV25115.1 hypothetical protein Q31a_34380 [Aureliella helgolandensis]
MIGNTILQFLRATGSRIATLIACVLLLQTSLLLSQDNLPKDIPDSIATFIDSTCVSCHQGAEPEGGLAFDQLGFNLANEETARRWILAYDRVLAGEMPPQQETRPDRKAVSQCLETLASAIRVAESQRNDVVLRRLNRDEYQNTVRDLFMVDVQIHGLPEDSSTDGFDTVGEGLAVSAEAMTAYLQAADQVLDAVLGSPVAPVRILHETNLLDQVDWQGNPQLESQIGKMFRRTADGLVIFQSGYCPTNLVNFARLRAPAGTYRGTLRVRAVQSDKPVTLRIYGGDTIVNRRERHLVGYYDVPPGEWTTIEFTDRLVEPGGTFQPKCYGTRDTRKEADTWPEPGIEIGDIVIEGPIEEWPPAARGRLLGDLNEETATTLDARRILERVLPRAFRRPVLPTESELYLDLFTRARSQERSFLSALRISLKAILCSPEFLFFHETGENSLDQHALATRLSYFLWSSMPDQELTDLANAGTLKTPEILRAQVERLLTSPKAKKFNSNFTGQWLGLREINFTEPDANLYPEFDELLRISMVRETEMFFQEILQHNLSLVNFVDSKFTFLNGRLASHYGITGVEGQAFRKVSLPADGPRGGLLTQASVLKVTANGTYTSPVLRGVWVLQNIIGQPTPPPPDNVGSIEPDIRGATTLREQLAKHRSLDSCATCHRTIDPPGFALECFDPIGGFRTEYRTMAAEGRRPEIGQAPFTYAWVRYRIGQPVDATALMHDGRSIESIQDLRAIIASDPELISRTLTKKLLTYAVGRRILFSDRPAVEEIVQQTRKQNYGFRSLVHSIVQSTMFQQQ